MTPPTVVLIDDDKLIHMSWSFYAKKKGIHLVSFFTVQDFLSHSVNFSKEIDIYVDSNLSDGILGEEESKLIHSAGFHNLYLATGYDDLDLARYPWIKGITGKKPTF